MAHGSNQWTGDSPTRRCCRDPISGGIRYYVFIDEHRHLSDDGTTRSAAATPDVHGVYVIGWPLYRPLAVADKDDSVADWSYLSARAEYEVSDAATGCCLPGSRTSSGMSVSTNATTCRGAGGAESRRSRQNVGEMSTAQVHVGHGHGERL